jgi:Pentapeptide repeats (8 copies)
VAGVVNPPSQIQEQWKDGERELREREVNHGGFGLIVQAAITVVAFTGAIVALVAATAAKDAVEVTAEGIERQAMEDRLSTAIESIGGEQAAQRVGGFALLRRHVGAQVSAASSDEERLDAYRLYTVGLDVLENYLRNPADGPTGSDARPAGLGYGKPVIPDDNRYAANELRALVNQREEVEALEIEATPRTPGPSVDLSRVQLTGQSWKGIDFSWLAGHNFVHVDLRAANLQDSVWGRSSLSQAYLQCADFTGANLIGTNLERADLRGATLIGANLMGANLTGADLRGADLSDVEGLKREQLDSALWDTNTGGLDEDIVAGLTPDELSTARPGTTDGTCLGDYQAFPDAGMPNEP